MDDGLTLSTASVVSVLAARCSSVKDSSVSAREERTHRAQLNVCTMGELDTGCRMSISVGKDATVEEEKEGKGFGHTPCTRAIAEPFW